MKKKPRIALAALSAALIASMALTPAMAATITVNGTGAGYDAYKLLSLTTSLKTGSEHTDHDGAHNRDCYNYSYGVEDKYGDILRAAADAAGQDFDADNDNNVTNDELIAGLGNMDADATRTFADAVYARVKDQPADMKATDKQFTGADQGYYLIVETATDGNNDSRSLVMLDTAGQQNITVNSKEGVPTVEKKIVEGADRVDATDAAIGDVVSYELTGTLPANLDGYDTYFYKFHDKVTGGLAIQKDSVKVTVNGVDHTSAFSISTEGATDGCDLEVAIDNLLSIGDVTASSTVKVTYDAKVVAEGLLTANTGNPNVVHLEFSNDPYNDGEGHRGTTPEDKVTVFSFKVVVNKTDKAGNALKGAKFTLQIQDGEAWKDVYTDIGDGGTTEFTFTGLDSGTYKLIESTVPDGYNKADDIIFEVRPTFDKTSDNPMVTALAVFREGEDISNGEGAEFSVDVPDGTITTSVVNTTGVQMPGTGGSGVYLIYAGGAILLAGGAALAVTKAKKEKNSAAA